MISCMGTRPLLIGWFGSCLSILALRRAWRPPMGQESGVEGTSINADNLAQPELLSQTLPRGLRGSLGNW